MPELHIVCHGFPVSFGPPLLSWGALTAFPVFDSVDGGAAGLLVLAAIIHEINIDPGAHTDLKLFLND